MTTLERTLLLRRATITDATIAGLCGIDASGLSRVYSNERGVLLEKIEAFLSAHGLKVVDVGLVTITPQRLASLTDLAQTGLHCCHAGTSEGECGRQ